MLIRLHLLGGFTLYRINRLHGLMVKISPLLFGFQEGISMTFERFNDFLAIKGTGTFYGLFILMDNGVSRSP